MNIRNNTTIEHAIYVIRQEEGFEAGIRRIIDEQTRQAIAHLRDESDIHKGIHDARRCLKVIRAAWRLIRMDLPADDFQRKNTFYRDAGRQLSELRDLTALLETLEKLQTKNRRMGRWVSRKTFCQILETKRTDKQREESAEDIHLLPCRVAEDLEQYYREVNQFQLSEHYTRNVLDSLQKVYARGYRAFLTCRETPDPEHMHEWRKRSKYLRYHFQMLSNAWPAVFITLESELHLLTDYLGDFNNLTVMKKHLESPEYELKAVHRKILMREAERYQQELQQQSINLGALLFAERPRAFVRRMESYLTGRLLS